MALRSTLWQRSVLAATLLAGAAATASAQTAFTAGNYVVVRVGDPSATSAPTSVATAAYLLEYTPTGTLVQTVAVPTTDSSPNLGLTLSGSASSEGLLTRSADGRYLLLTGYNAPVGTTGVAGTAAASTNRVVARIAASGTINSTTRISDAFDANNVRSAASADGSAFYVAGANSGLRYVTLGSTGTTIALTPTSATTGSPTNLRAVGLFGGNLYVSSASQGVYGPAQVGTGRPTTSGQTFTTLTGFPTASGPSPYGFFFADLSPTVAGVDVAYVADDSSTGGIQKWSLVSGTWTLNGTIGGNTSASVRGLAGSVNLLVNPTNPPVTLAASGGGGLFVVTDNTGYNAAPTATLATAVATPAANTVFRGVALAPLATALAARPEASQAELALYPNPAQDVLTLGLVAGGPAAGHQAEVRDLLGRVVRSATVPASGQLSLAGLPAGTYQLTVDGTLTRRISKIE